MRTPSATATPPCQGQQRSPRSHCGTRKRHRGPRPAVRTRPAETARPTTAPRRRPSCLPVPCSARVRRRRWSIRSRRKYQRVAEHSPARRGARSAAARSPRNRIRHPFLPPDLTGAPFPWRGNRGLPLCRVRLQLEAEIGGAAECVKATRDVVRAGFRDGGHAVQRHAAGISTSARPAMRRNRFADVVERHVVDPGSRGTCGNRRIDLLHTLGLDLDRHLLA